MVLYEHIAATRLYWLLKPNVSFPVPNGDPNAGMSGYNFSIVSESLASTLGPKGDGVKFAMRLCLIWSSVVTNFGEKIVATNHQSRTLNTA